MNKQDNPYKFSEGEIYSFKVKGITNIPGTDISFYVLENPFGGKHLLKAIHYKHYGLEVNQLINCKIDKINCSGKIFLEPENPFYKEGQVYEFDVEHFSTQVNSVGVSEIFVEVKDIYGKKTHCSLPIDFSIPLNFSKLNCKVIRIKKGELFLLHSEKENSKKYLEINKVYWFTLEQVKKINDTQYYIFKDDYQNLYSLKESMYKHYGFSIGEKVKCKVTKYNTDGNLKIEPEHPHYEVGEFYNFEFFKVVEEKDSLGNKEDIIIVKDILGIETKVRTNLPSNINFIDKDIIKCKVEGIRKGKAILSFEKTDSL